MLVLLAVHNSLCCSHQGLLISTVYVRDQAQYELRIFNVTTEGQPPAMTKPLTRMASSIVMYAADRQLEPLVNSELTIASAL